MKTWTIVIALAGILWLAPPAAAKSSSQQYPVIATGAQREEIKSKHILNRPNRPGHFYGNTVRRRHHRMMIQARYRRR